VLVRLTLVALLVPAGSHAQDSQLTESKLKAAFLFNFAKYVEWPPDAFASPTTPITIGLLGDNPIAGDLETIVRDRTIDDRHIVVKAVQSVIEATNCQVLFVGNLEKEKVPQFLSGLGAARVLTVGDTEQFLEMGGMINFVKEGNKIRFQINEPAAKRAGLKVSSKLLSLAVH
jgi:YfiR/HmsC-like